MNLLWDSARKCIDLSEWFRNHKQVTGWRKSASWKREIKRIFRASSKAGRSGGKDKETRLQHTVASYLQLCKKLENKVVELLNKTTFYTDDRTVKKHQELHYFHEMLVKHIRLVDRRIMGGETIPSSEKLYSIFETHSEWLSKGKKFNPVEIGHNVLIATDQFHFIIHHQVLENETDVEVAQDVATTLVDKYPGLITSLSFDKGFYSKENKAFIKKIIPETIMPKRGKRNKAETQQEHQAEFMKLRHAHCAVESNINQLEHNGLNRCPDKGVKNFKCYTALSVLAYNFHKLGEYLRREQVLKKVA